MHLSLDLALGQPENLPSFTNRFGEPVFGFSLRDLNGENPDIVNVERQSDNATRIFKAPELASGEIETWAGGNSARVLRWYNQGSGNDFIQNTVTNAPFIVDASGNYLGALRFNNAAIHMNGSITQAQPYVQYWVLERTFEPAFQFIYVDASSPNGHYWYFQSSAPIILSDGSQITYSAITGRTLEQFSIVENGTSSDFRRNGSSLATGTLGAPHNGSFTLGETYGTANDFDIKELLIYGDTVNTDIESNQTSHYGI